MSVRYAIRSLAEAKAYLLHPVLGARLRECVAAMNAHTGLTAGQVLGDIDACKFRSCLTLFARADRSEPIFREALDRYFAGEPDPATLAILGDTAMPGPSSNEYLLLSRGQWNPQKSQEEIQGAIDSFYAWYDQLVAEGRFRRGHRLAAQGKRVSATGITDGPFAEAKEIIGGYWIIVAGSLQEAADIAAANPCLACGLTYEIRPIELERASAYRVSNETPAERR